MTGEPYDPSKPSWSIMTKSRGGIVSLLRDLTLEQARLTYDRLDPLYGSAVESYVVHKDYRIDGGVIVWSSDSDCSRPCHDSDIEVREVFGPPGWDGFNRSEIGWPKFFYIYTDANGNILPDDLQDHPERAARHRDRRGQDIATQSEANAPPSECVDAETDSACAPSSGGRVPCFGIAILIGLAVMIALAKCST